eukprot:GFUD01115425.1.p1 GENE.GFUD01115425.1~~GFUD01115425.1.p1  ORF type:complete len:116 (-),score=11.39 GFUD01115425.1:60-407(-)
MSYESLERQLRWKTDDLKRANEKIDAYMDHVFACKMMMHISLFISTCRHLTRLEDKRNKGCASGFLLFGLFVQVVAVISLILVWFKKLEQNNDNPFIIAIHILVVFCKLVGHRND